MSRGGGPSGSEFEHRPQATRSAATHASDVRRWLVLTLVALAAMGCRQDMHDQPRYEALEASAFFANGMASRPLPAGTIARGFLRDDDRLWKGKDENNDFIREIPVELTRETLEWGRTRFEVFCSPCHDSTGSGRGMIVRRGFKQPPPLYEARIIALPEGYFYDVITNGFGLMSSYANQIPVRDRWAIVAYIRALQLSQTARLARLPVELREEFERAIALPPEGEGEPAAEDGH